MHYLLFYETVADYEQRRQPYRAAHLAHAWAAVERGVLVLGGAFAHPVDGAVLLFACDSPQPVYEFVAGDPYVVNGLVKKWTVREWTTVVGLGASQPTRPADVR
ncbi:MAG: YciI-like protein [Gemmataceae bacterium]|nr:YciI-like protein [Gemmata sp.]MDW8195990.1 YciI-like protein [Gemmataceae bacterium]